MFRTRTETTNNPTTIKRHRLNWNKQLNLFHFMPLPSWKGDPITLSSTQNIKFRTREKKQENSSNVGNAEGLSDGNLGKRLAHKSG